VVSSVAIPLNQASITSSPSFEARLQRSELRGATILAACWAVAVLTAIIRRELGGLVMTTNAVFFPYVGIFAGALAYETLLILSLRRHLREGKTFARWRRLLAVTVELAIPTAALVLLELFSPRSAYAILNAPILLAFPIIVLLSILRLRPKLTLAMGLATALIHAALVTYSIRADHIDVHQWPLLYTYAAILALTGVAASLVAAQGRANVIEAVRESMSAEHEQRARNAIERDLDIARDIQSGLMPSTAPDIAGFDIAGMARPAQQTGGDYYDWQSTAEGRLIVALADVTGHGIGPALVMAVCRAYARATAASATDAAALLNQVNALIVEDIGQSGRFITMAIAILSPDGTVELVSAGHGPTMLYRKATGEVTTFGGDGLPLGVMADERYGPSTTFRMESGDMLVLATDGFMEWPRAGDGQQFGSERLSETVARGARGTAREMLTELDASVMRFVGGGPQQDDTTAVAIKRI
jgi:serine phosphatase RsbU (regulator of sigma subunit)